jgi:hypothetical protein
LPQQPFAAAWNAGAASAPIMSKRPKRIRAAIFLPCFSALLKAVTDQEIMMRGLPGEVN